MLKLMNIVNKIGHLCTKACTISAHVAAALFDPCIMLFSVFDAIARCSALWTKEVHTWKAGNKYKFVYVPYYTQGKEENRNSAYISPMHLFRCSFLTQIFRAFHWIASLRAFVLNYLYFLKIVQVRIVYESMSDREKNKSDREGEKTTIMLRDFMRTLFIQRMQQCATSCVWNELHGCRGHTL